MAKDHRRVDAELVQEVLLDDPSFLREIVERAVQQILEAQMTEHVGGVAPYERVEGRTGQRNGHKLRALHTRVGTLNLLVPQDREGTFASRLFSRYQRNEKALVLALMEMYVEGSLPALLYGWTQSLVRCSNSPALFVQLLERRCRALGSAKASRGGETARPNGWLPHPASQYEPPRSTPRAKRLPRPLRRDARPPLLPRVAHAAPSPRSRRGSRQARSGRA